MAVDVEQLRNDGDDREQHADDAILEHADPDDLVVMLVNRPKALRESETYIKPCQPTPWLPQWPFILSTGAVLYPENAPEPISNR